MNGIELHWSGIILGTELMQTPSQQRPSNGRRSPKVKLNLNCYEEKGDLKFDMNILKFKL